MTLMCGKSAYDWNTVLTLRWKARVRVMSVPPIRIWPAGGVLEAGDHPQGRGLAAARGPEQGEEGPLRDGEVEGLHRGELAEALGQPDQPEVPGLVLRHQLAVRSEKALEYLVSSSAVRPLKTLARERTSSLGKISGLSAVSGSSLARASLVPTTGGM